MSSDNMPVAQHDPLATWDDEEYVFKLHGGRNKCKLIEAACKMGIDARPVIYEFTDRGGGP